jgi:predicted RecB family nuclease
MTAKITREVLESHLKCSFKAHLKLTEQHGEKSKYEMMLTEQREQVRLASLDKILCQQPMDQVERGIALNSESLKQGFQIILDAVLEDDTVLLGFDGLKRVAGKSKLGSFHYVPMLFCESRHLYKEQKLLIAVFATILARLQSRQPDYGIIWHGGDCRSSKIRLRANQHDPERLLESLLQIRADEAAPPLVLNNHCPACEFRHRCRSQATDADNLSLVRGIGPKDIKSYARKGILTVSQLSHTFRPRRKGKRTEPGSHKRHHSLQAMAIRDKTIYVLGRPELRACPVRVYLDIEADPEKGFVYLIGMIVLDGTVEKRLSFWADSREGERQILEECSAALSQHDDFVLFSYGSYETAFLKRMQKEAQLKPLIERLLKNSVNILSVIYGHFYFPTYSNGLKDIGTCLGCSWNEPDASGLQSIVWRAKWETTGDDVWKQKLLRYNLDDCAALRVVTDQVYAITAAQDSPSGTLPPVAGRFRVADVKEIDQQGRIRKWGVVNFVQPDFAYVNGCAYFSYQRQRVYVKTNSTLRKNRVQPTGHRHRRLKVNRRVEILVAECERCQSKDILTISGRLAGKKGPRGKRAFDLVGSAGGVKLSVIEVRSKLYQCRTCGAVFVPTKYERLARYFHGVKSWAMYQHVAHGLSFGTIRDMIDVFFDLPISKSDLHKVKAEMARYYDESCRRLWQKLLAGTLLHVDETQIRLKGGVRGYVWAFTNLEEVVFVFRPNREGEFLRDLLKDFKGVLVSDFYAAYDSLDCPQQKCLIHLIRDMNDELLESPFDDELQAITQPFGSLLRPIVASIGEHGLRRWYLRRFKRDVANFFQLVSSLSPRSDVAQALRHRLLKYRDKLFTFLDYDDIPWNNNNAENAIKRFAYYRAHASGMMRESGVANFLALLSVCQTCKYKGINFWKFLSSRSQNIDGFTGKKSYSQSSALDVYPEGVTLLQERFRKAKASAQ